MPRKVAKATKPDPLENIDSNPEEKYCTTCGQRKGIDEFHKDADKADGHRDTCKECRARLEKLKITQEMDERLSRLEEEALVHMESLTVGGTLTPHINEMLASIMHTFGGVDGYARALKANYLAAKPGSQARTKTLAVIMQLTAAVTRADLAERQLEDASDADVRKIMIDCMREWQAKNKLPASLIPVADGDVIDVTAINTPESSDA